MVNSYALPKLTGQYHDGTRQWMYDKVDSWLKAKASRLLLVLAGPGMGKSVFSAVMSKKLQVRAGPVRIGEGDEPTEGTEGWPCALRCCRMLILTLLSCIEGSLLPPLPSCALRCCRMLSLT